MRWNELLYIISNLSERNISGGKANKLTYQEWCKILNSIPGLVAWHLQDQVEVFFKEIVKNCWKKCLDKTNLIPAYKVIINDEEMFWDTLLYFKRFLSNTANKENLTTDNKTFLSTWITTQNLDWASSCIITKKLAKERKLSETHRSTENIQLLLCFTNEIFNERWNNFTASMLLHESKRISKTAYFWQKAVSLSKLMPSEMVILWGHFFPNVKNLM